MSELGQWLREARQARGLSLEQVEAETRIRTKFLTALEEGNYDELPAEVYTKGFLRNYALFLGLDPAEALAKYEKRDIGRRSGEPNLFHPLEVALFRATGGRLRGRLVLLILIAALLTAVLWAWQAGRLAWLPPLTLFRSASLPVATPVLDHTSTPTSQPAAIDTRQATPTRTPSLTPTSGPGASPTASPTPRPTSTPGALPSPTKRPVEPPTPTATPTQAAVEPPTAAPTPTLKPGIGVTLQVTITEQSWIEVTLDGIGEFRGMLNTGEQRTWQARREIILLAGNAGGVQATVNGEFLGTLGERQQVVEFAWGPEGQVTPAPTATATPESTIEMREAPPQ